jgi:hypothetical protein
MANILQYEVEDYQRALDRYNRSLDSYNSAVDTYKGAVNAYNQEVAGYNSKVTDYQNSFLRNDSDQPLVYQPSTGMVYAVDTASGQLSQASLPSGKISDYGLTAIPDESRFLSIRQGTPVEANRITGTAYMVAPQDNYEGGGYVNFGPGPQWLHSGHRNYYLAPKSGSYGEPYGAEWRLDGSKTETVPDPYQEGSPSTRTVYLVSKDASTWQEAPPAFNKEFTDTAPTAPNAPRTPSFSLSDERKLAQGTNSERLAAGERGLINNVIRSRGVK